MEIVQSPNILNWYPFIDTDKILMIGKNSPELVNAIKERTKNVKELEQYDFGCMDGEKYDYIILIGILENWKQTVKTKSTLEELLSDLTDNLNENGKIIFSVDNKFGLRFFAGNPEKVLHQKFKSLIGYNNETEKVESFTKTILENMIKRLGFNARFYYPLPDYKMPNVIFTDDELPEYNSIDKYNPYFEKNSDILFNEIDVFREILKTDENMFTFFSNSFLVEISKGECNKEYKYISFNNMRKEEYRLITKIADTYVEKQKVTSKAESHYEQIKENIKYLESNNIKTVDYVENGIIKSKYVDQKYLLNNVLTEKLEKGKLKDFYDIIDNYIQIISKNSYKEKDYNKTIFAKYQIKPAEEKIIENMDFLQHGLWDMTFKNCFYVDNDFLFFDQEWKEDNLPVQYILYRSILYTISLRRFINIEDLFKKYNLTQYINLFENLDNKIQEKIRDDDVWRFYSENHTFDIDATKQELINLNIRDEAKQKRIDELEKENKELIKNNQELNNEVQNLNTKLHTGFFRKVQNKLDKLGN